MQRRNLLSAGGRGDYNFKQALSLNGVNNYLTLPFAVSSQSQLTLSCWFQVSALDNNVLLGNIGGDILDYIRVDPGLDRIITRNSTGGIGFVNFSIPSLSINTWYHLYFADNGTNGRLFVNGIESSSGALATGGNWNFDSIARNTSDAIGGQLDDLTIWYGYDDPVAESTAIYNGGLGADPLSIMPSSEYLFRFNNNYNNNGSLGGATTPFNSPTFVPHI